MLYRYLISKKGFTMMEMLIVVAVLGVLVGIAVPVFDASLKVQKRNDCRNQVLVIQTAVKQVMFGMIDNGKRQTEINIASWPDGGEFYKRQYNPNDENLKLNVSSEHNYKYYTKLDDVLTIGKIRGGYRDINQYPDYRDGCSYDPVTNTGGTKYYLKKKALENIEFYKTLDLEEVDGEKQIPVCPFANYENDTTEDDYFYCIFYDGTVCCTCPECNK